MRCLLLLPARVWLQRILAATTQRAGVRHLALLWSQARPPWFCKPDRPITRVTWPTPSPAAYPFRRWDTDVPTFAWRFQALEWENRALWFQVNRRTYSARLGCP